MTHDGAELWNFYALEFKFDWIPAEGHRREAIETFIDDRERSTDGSRTTLPDATRFVYCFAVERENKSFPHATKRNNQEHCQMLPLIIILMCSICLSDLLLLHIFPSRNSGIASSKKRKSHRAIFLKHPRREKLSNK